MKENQPNLNQAIHDFFSEHLEDDCDSIACRRFESHEKGHGHVDDRYDYLTKLPDDFPLKETWMGPKAMGRAVIVTEHNHGKHSGDVRYYITSRCMSGERFNKAVRGHWGIENSLH